MLASPISIHGPTYLGVARVTAVVVVVFPTATDRGRLVVAIVELVRVAFGETAPVLPLALFLAVPAFPLIGGVEVAQPLAFAFAVAIALTFPFPFSIAVTLTLTLPFAVSQAVPLPVDITVSLTITVAQVPVPVPVPVSVTTITLPPVCTADDTWLAVVALALGNGMATVSFVQIDLG